MGNKQTISSLVTGGEASAGPPLGPAMGPMGVNIMQVIEAINEKTKEIKGMKARNQMLLLNLLGGRLPLGHRMVGESVTMLKRVSSENLDRILRRIRRVGQMLEEAIV